MDLQDLIAEVYAKQNTLQEIEGQLSSLQAKHIHLREEISHLLDHLKQQATPPEQATPTTPASPAATGAPLAAPGMGSVFKSSPFSAGLLAKTGISTAPAALLGQAVKSLGGSPRGWSPRPTRVGMRGRASVFRNQVEQLLYQVGRPMSPRQIAEALAQQMPGRDPERLRKHVIVALNKYSKQDGYFQKLRHGVFALAPRPEAPPASATGTA